MVIRVLCNSKCVFNAFMCNIFQDKLNSSKDKRFKRKRLSTEANFVQVCSEIWDKGMLKFNKFSIEQQCDS